MILKNRTTVGLVQVNNSFSGQSYFPYSVGVLQAYAEKHLTHPGSYEFLPPVFNRIRVEEAVEQLLSADIAAFSLYVWNAQISLRIAERLKARNPDVLIVVGGPHVPNQGTEGFLKKNPFIDVVVHGEGEKPFCAILENLANWHSAPSISYLDGGKLVQTPKAERMKDLGEVPSPYLEGTFDALIAANPNEQWIAVWETNRGCPFGCTFCDWGSATNAKIGRWEIDRLLREVDWFASRKTFYVFCADANFGILPRDLEIAKYCVDVKARTNYPSKLSVQNMKSTTRDALEKSWAVQKVLSDGGMNQGVVVSMQSLHMPTLRAIKRDNMKPEFFREIQRRFTEGDVDTMSDLILGMPEETYDSFANGVSELIGGGQHNRIQFNNLSILPNAEMGDPFYRGQYGMKTVTSKIVNIHGSKSQDDEIPEFQELVIATKAMPREDWVRARAFAWMVGLLHFDKILQIPLVLAHELSGISYRELIELFSEGNFGDAGCFPIIAKLREFFLAKARDIQDGGEEYCHSAEWLDIWWPADEYAMIQMVVHDSLGDFYEEAGRLLVEFLGSRDANVSANVLQDAVFLNSNLVKVPFQSSDLPIELRWNVWEFYQAAIRGQTIALEEGLYISLIDRTSVRWESWECWFREVIWWGNKRGAYLYGNASTQQLAGHF